MFHHQATLIDSGEATAEAVAKLLDQRKLRNKDTMKPYVRFLVSDVPHKFTEIGERFLGTTLGRV